MICSKTLYAREVIGSSFGNNIVSGIWNEKQQTMHSFKKVACPSCFYLFINRIMHTQVVKLDLERL